MNQVELNASEIKDYLEYVVSNNQYIQEKGKTPIAVEIIGESGLGKTSVSLQLAKNHNMHHVKLNLAQIEELGDLIGFPMRQFQMTKAGGTPGTPARKIKKMVMQGDKKVLKEVIIPAVPGTANKPEWIDEVAVEQHTKLGYVFTKKTRMSYCAPEWIADREGGGFLILDDWNRADTRFIQAVMDLIDRQEYISWKLPKNWHIVLTANPDDGNYIVQSLDVAQKTRFMSTVMKWDVDCWAEWAEKSDIDSRCINFLLMHPEIVKGAVNPRSLTNFFNSISSMTEFENKLPMIQNLGEGSIGPTATLLFTTFINNRMDKWMMPVDIMTHKDDQLVIDTLKEMFGSNNDYRADIASVLTTRLINFALYYAESNPITPEIIDRLTLLVKENGVFTDDLKYVLVKKILNGNKQKFQKLIADNTIQELVTR